MNRKLHIVLARPGFSDLLVEEFRDLHALQGEAVNTAAISLAEAKRLPPLDATIFARQYLPRAMHLKSADLQMLVEHVMQRLEVMAQRPNRQQGRWTLHAFALDDDPCTQHAVKLEKAVLAAVKAKLSRFAKRYVAPAELTKAEAKADDFLIQLYVPALDQVWLSIANVETEVSPWIAGNRRMRDRVGSPSRSARKLEEALVVLGRQPRRGETVVDLGAAPGGWSFSMARYGAQVTAVDHAELALPPEQKLRGEVTHLKENGLKYMPPETVDWLCCDMVIGSRETLRVLGHWFAAGAMRNFVVNVKLPRARPWPEIKEALALLEGRDWAVLKAKHLYHDRREITLVGSREPI